MQPQTVFNHRGSPARWRQEGAGGGALFLLASLASHAAVFGAAVYVGGTETPRANEEPAWIELFVEAQDPVVRAPEASPSVEDEAKPNLRPAAQVKDRPAPPTKTKTAAPTVLTKLPTKEAPPIEAEALPSVDDASSTDETTETNIVRAEEQAPTSRPTAMGLGDGSDQAVDPRALIRAWMKRVQRVVQTRALRDYPRSARRLRLQGNVIISMTVDRNGRVQAARPAHSSGHESLDQAAVQAVLAVAELPSPPAAFLRYDKPLTIPVAYRIR